MKVLTAKQMREVDRLSTEEFGVPSLTLMENAGVQLYLELLERFEDLETLEIAILCGKGNNGGDGLVLARQLLQRGIVPDVFLLADRAEVRGDAAVNLEILLRWGLPVLEVTSVETWQAVADRLEVYDLLIDALLGTGITQDLQGLYLEVVRDLNQTGGFVLAVDLPSGMPSDAVEAAPETVWADATVTFTAPKVAHILNRDVEALGELSVVPIGTPPQLLDRPDFWLHVLTRDEASQLYFRRAADSHKGTYGHVGIVAGARGKSGAAVLSAYAALRSGSGLVTALTPECIQDLVASHRPELMTQGFAGTPEGAFAPSTLEAVLAALGGKNAVGLGPGLSTGSETVAFVRRLVRECPLPLIIDADGLNALAGDAKVFPTRRGGARSQQPSRILTPHPGEFSRLIDQPVAAIQRDPAGLARAFALRHQVWVVLKMFRTLIATPDGQVYVSPVGNPGMATAGMGDVLTGIITSIVGQFAAQERTSAGDVTAALCLAVTLHGLAGNAAARESGGDSLLAGDVIECLAEAFEELVGE